MSGGGGGEGAFAEEPEAHENHERYLLTYADMITLLMALFIILFAIGQTDIAKFKRFQVGLQKEFGAPALDGGVGLLNGSQLQDVSAGAAAVSPGLADPSELEAGTGGGSSTGDAGSTPAAPVEITYANADQSAQTIATALAHAGLTADQVRLDVDQRGLVIVFATDDVIFAPGSWTLQPQALRTLEIVNRAIRRVSNPVLVEGHTDSRPMNPPLTNWELSGNRAAAVVRYFEGPGGVDATRLSLSGYADTRPVDTNDTAQGRARNRRVEIILAIDDRPQQLPKPIVDPIVDPAKPPSPTIATR